MPDYKEIKISYECTNCGNKFTRDYPISARIRTVTTIYGNPAKYNPGRRMAYIGDSTDNVQGKTHIETSSGGAPVRCHHCKDSELKILTRKPTETEE